MNSRPQAWFKQAKDDLGVAKLTRDNAYNCQACYFASQAEPAYTHVLGELIKQLKQLGCNVEALDSLPLSSLSRLAAASRYPIEATPAAELFEPADANQAISTAAAVLELVEALDTP